MRTLGSSADQPATSSLSRSGFMKYPPGASRPPPQPSDIRSSTKKPDTNGSKAKAEASTSAGVPVKQEHRMEEDGVKDEDDSEGEQEGALVLMRPPCLCIPLYLPLT
jgi:hypothetical protein